MYFGQHRVHNVSRNFAILAVSYIELLLISAVIYLGLGHQFNPRVTGFGDALYLSATTITTLGYGDIRPTCSGVRVLLGFQSLSGIALLGLAITRVLGLIPRPKEALHRNSDRDDEGA